MRKIVKYYSRIILVLVILTAMVVPFFTFSQTTQAYSGSFTKQQSVTVTDNTGTARADVPALLSINGTTHYTSGYINVNGTNTAMVDNATAADETFMIGDHSGTIIPNLPAYGSVNYNLLMGTSTNQTNFPLITGAGGYFTVPSVAGLQPSANFSIAQNIYVDTSVVGSLITNKQGVYMEYVPVAGNVTAQINSGEQFTADTWTDVGTKIHVTVGNERLEYESEKSGADDRCYKDLTAMSNTNWRLDFTLNNTAKGTVGGSMAFGMWSSNTQWNTYAGDALFVQVFNNPGIVLYIERIDGGATALSATGVNITLGTPYYVTLERNTAILSTLKVYSDPGRTTQITGSPVTLAIPAGVQTLRYIQAANYADGTGAGNEVIGWIDEPAWNLTATASPYTSVTAPVSSGEHTITNNGTANYPAWATGNVLHFDGTATGDLNCGVIYNASAKFAVSMWFKLDSNFGAGAPTVQRLYVKDAGGGNIIVLHLDNGSGRIEFFHVSGGVTKFNIATVQNSWVAGTWYYVYAATGQAIGGGAASDGARLRMNNGVAVTDADTTAIPNGGTLIFGNYGGGVAQGVIGNLQNIAIMNDDVSTIEETALYNGTAPVDATDYWYADEGVGTVITSYGTAANPGTAGAATTWQTSTYTSGQTGRLCDFTMTVDSNRWGSNLKGASVPNNANQWEFWREATGEVVPYGDNVTIIQGGVLRAWYAPTSRILGDVLPDRSGTNTGTIHWGANPTNSLIITYGAVINAPGVTTSDASGITALSAYLYGQVTGVGGEPYVNAGFQYGQDTTYGLGSTPLQQITSISSYYYQITGLSPNTVYHFRAFITYGAGVYIYGADKTFTTSPASGSSRTLTIKSAKMFQGYMATGDLLLTVEEVNTYTDLYPNEDPTQHFVIQLLATDNLTILGQSSIANWGWRPASIYFNPTFVTANLTPIGSAYYVKMLGDQKSGYATTNYRLIPSTSDNTDWMGSNLSKLDAWCIGTAANMGLVDGASQDYYRTLVTGQGYQINDAGGAYFTSGIPNISTIRPLLFTTTQQQATINAGTAMNIWDKTDADPAGWRYYFGAVISGDIDTMAIPFGINGKDFMAGIFMIIMLGCVMLVVGGMGGFGALGATLIAIPILWLGTYFRAVPIAAITAVVIIFGFFAIRQFVVKTL